jgi:signal transduction histidine kinase
MNKPKEPILLTPEQIEELVGRFKTHQQELKSENEMLHKKLVETRYWILRSHEEERVDLAQSLHGGPIQELSSLLFEINTLEQMLDDEDCATIVVAIRDNLKGAIRSLRKYINVLHPPALIHFGLQPAIYSYIEQLQTEHADLNIAFLVNTEERLPNREVEQAIYRVLQHLVQNVVDHAQARSLLIRLHIGKRDVRLDVEDDGVGFQFPNDEGGLLAQKQMGLFKTRMIVESFGGTLEIRSTPGEGTSVRATIASE